MVVLLNVSSHCDPSTLVSLRLLNRTTKYLFDTFERSICVASGARLAINDVAYRRDPNARYTFEGLSRTWRHEQHVRYLVTEIGARADYMFLTWEPIACPEAWIPIRIRLEEACHLWFHFSDIAKEVEDSSKDNLSRRPLTRARQLEPRIFRERIMFLESLTESDILNLASMWYMLSRSNHIPGHYQLLFTESNHYSWERWLRLVHAQAWPRVLLRSPEYLELDISPVSWLENL